MGFFALACERTFIKTHSIESRCYRTGKYTVSKRVRASFSPKSLQAGGVTGLKQRPGVRRFQLSSLPDLIQAQSASLVARIDDDVDDNDDKITQTWISSRDIDTDEYSVEYSRKHV